MDKLLTKSLKKKRPVKLLTNHPDGQSFEGIVIYLTKSLIVIREIKDLEIDGVVAFPRQAISNVIDCPVESQKKELMKRDSNERAEKMTKWLKKVKNIKDLIGYPYKSGEWVAVETVRDDDSTVFVGSIQDFSGKTFCVSPSLVTDKRKKGRKVRYSDLFRIEIYSSYISSIRDYVNLSW